MQLSKRRAKDLRGSFLCVFLCTYAFADAKFKFHVSFIGQACSKVCGLAPIICAVIAVGVLRSSCNDAFEKRRTARRALAICPGGQRFDASVRSRR